jgi:light-regulated signal transduction histidine kinase (bacteriophytochrome)
MDGIGFLSLAMQIDPTLATVIMLGQHTIDATDDALQIGAVDYLAKPVRMPVMLSVLERALELRRLRQENDSMRRREQQQVAELLAVHAQLEEFSHSISHDLRAPLHTISGFCDLYMTQFGDRIPDEGRELLTHVLDGCRRMYLLIDDLIRYCRSSRQPMMKSTVPTAKLVKRIVAELQAAAGGRSVEVRIGPLPDCEADPLLLEQVFSNLLSNAFKFTRRRGTAHIEVGCLSRHGEQVLFVRDDGVGFDMHRAGKLFGVFHRLHAMSEYEGSGVGLAMAQQIVARHGGRIWADSEPDDGATFYFTLGAVKPADEPAEQPTARAAGPGHAP